MCRRPDSTDRAIAAEKAATREARRRRCVCGDVNTECECRPARTPKQRTRRVRLWPWNGNRRV